jgi:IS5 family transposase
MLELKQTTFASLAWNAKGRTTRRERFLGEMNAVVPWARLTGLIEPHHPKGNGGRPPMPLEWMPRIYFMQQWFNLSDPQAEDALYDIEPMRRFAGIELAEEAIPDESTILHFRHLLEKRPLTDHEKMINRSRSRRRIRGDFAFRVVKRLWGFSIVRYRGLLKNTVRAFALFALANLYTVRRRLLPRQA